MNNVKLMYFPIDSFRFRNFFSIRIQKIKKQIWQCDRSLESKCVCKLSQIACPPHNVFQGPVVLKNQVGPKRKQILH